MCNFRKITKLFIVILTAFCFILPVFSQSLSLTPKKTELLEQKEENQDGIIIKNYRFHSHSSKEQIGEFYKQMFLSAGFKESKQSTKDKNVLLFLKTDSIALLNFVADYEDKTAIYYYVQLQEFSGGTAAEAAGNKTEE